MANNLPTVTVSQFNEIVKLQFEEGIKRPIFGLGKGGIGKTESIAELAKELNIGYIDIRLLLYSEVDLKGIPYPDKNHISTIWLQNDILPREDRDGKTGILVLDEITSVSRSVRTAAYQLLNERCLGEYRLPDGWLVVCLGNGEEDGGSYEGMEGNFANRCSIFNVVPDVEAWKDWAYKKDVNYLVIGYVTWRPSELHTFDPNNDTDLLFASPRSWKAVSDILNIHGYNKDDMITNHRIIANVGSRVGNNFTSFCKYKETAVDPNEILAGKKVPQITEVEVLIITIQSVINLMHKYINDDKNNLNMITDDTLAKCAHGISWMLSLDTLEHRVMAIKDFTRVDRAIATKIIMSTKFKTLCPELTEFVRENINVLK